MPVLFMTPWLVLVLMVGVVCCVSAGAGAGAGNGAGDQLPSAAIMVLSLLDISLCCSAISAFSCAIDALDYDAPAIDLVLTENPLITSLPNSWKPF